MDDLLGTVSEHGALEVPVVSPQMSIGEVVEAIGHTRFRSVAAVAVCEGGRLSGIIRMEDLFAADASASAAEVMDRDPPVVAPGVDQEHAAWKAVKHRESTIAIVDEHGAFCGFVPPDRLLAVLLHEHDEDLARLGGFLHDASAARITSREPVLKRYLHRMPWLLIGLVGAFVAAKIVAAFETQLEKQVVLAFFIPGIVYMAAAVGIQTETLIVRGLSLGVSIREVVRREIVTGVLVGLSLSVLFFPVALWLWRDAVLVGAISFALFAACSTATAIGMLLPWLLHRGGKDPAFGSGPLSTVTQDLLSILIYFGIVMLVTD